MIKGKQGESSPGSLVAWDLPPEIYHSCLQWRLCFRGCNLATQSVLPPHTRRCSTRCPAATANPALLQKLARAHMGPSWGPEPEPLLLRCHPRRLPLERHRRPPPIQAAAEAAGGAAGGAEGRAEAASTGTGSEAGRADTAAAAAGPDHSPLPTPSSSSAATKRPGTGARQDRSPHVAPVRDAGWWIPPRQCFQPMEFQPPE